MDMSMDSFTCPICFKTELKIESMKLTNCNHYLCWTCCGKQMRITRQVAIKCPQCRSQETLTQIRRCGAHDDENEMYEDDENEMDDDEEDDDDYNNEDYCEEEQDEPLSQHKTTFINGTFNIRFSRCRFNSANPFGHQ